MNTKQKKATSSLCEPVAFEKSVGLSADGTRVCVQEDNTKNIWDCQALSPAAQARLALLSARSKLTPTQIIESIILAADAQMIRVCASMRPGLVAGGFRPRRFIPVQFIVAEEDSE